MKKKKAKPISGPAERAFVDARNQLRNRPNILLGLSRYKLTASPHELRQTLPFFLQQPAYRKLIWNVPFPRSTNEIGFGGLVGIASFEQELIWNVEALLPHATTISEFSKCKLQCENAFLLGDKARANTLLEDAKEKFGYSIWLVETRINFSQTFETFRTQRRYVHDLIGNAKLHPFTRFLISWMSFRSEGNISHSEFYRQLESIDPHHGGFSNLCHILLGSFSRTTSEQAAAMLSYIDMFPILDRYLMLIAIVQSYVASGANDHIDTIRDALIPLAAQIEDQSLAMLLSVVGGAIPPNRESALPALFSFYERGEYDNVIAAAEKVLPITPNIDVLFIYLRAKTASGREAAIEGVPQAGLFREITVDLAKIVTFAEDASQAALRLQKMIVMYTNSAWASALALILEHQRHDERIFEANITQRARALRVPDETPTLFFCLEKMNLTSECYLDHLRLKLGDPVMGCISARMAATEQPIIRSVNQIIADLRASNVHEALEKLRPMFESTRNAMFRGEIGILLAITYLRKNDILACAEICVSLFQLSTYFAALLPLESLADRIVQSSEKLETPDSKIYGRIPIVLIFEICSRFVSTRYDPARVDALKDFLKEQKVESPSELARKSINFPREQLVHFFKYVCVPDVLDQLLSLTSTRAVEDERAKILVHLSELTSAENKTPAPELLDELRDIRTRQVVRETTYRLDQSKIFVSVDGIRKAIDAHLREDWHRYKLITLQQGASSNYEDMLKALEEKLGGITVVSLALPLTERNQLFASIVFAIRDMFALSKEFGLDANLSTNIRHGFVMREIRGPLVAHHLVTNKTSEAGGYQPNQYWLDRLELIPDDLQTVHEALEHLSESIDGEIERLNRRLLRIRSDQATDGLFDFTINEVALQLLQRKLGSSESYEDFFDGVIDVLWAQTNQGLERVREVLSSDTLRKLQAAIAQLQSRLLAIGRTDELSGLLSATNLARTDLAAAIERVASWFTLSVNNEYQDYQLQISFEAGLATVRSYYSHLDIRPELSFETILMAGRTLPSFTRLFSMLLDNAAYHSKIDDGALILKGVARHEDGVLSISVTNSLAPSVDRTRLSNRIMRINSEFGREPASGVISQEGGSGYPKIWKILTHDLGGAHALEVSLTANGEFQVQIVIDEKNIVL